MRRFQISLASVMILTSITGTTIAQSANLDDTVFQSPAAVVREAIDTVDVTVKGDRITSVTTTLDWKGTVELDVMPYEGYTIKSLSVGKNSLKVDGGSLTVNGVRVTSNLNKDGSVTLTATSTGSASFADIDIVAESVRTYSLNVDTDSRIESDVRDEEVESGTKKVITLTPDRKYGVSSLSVTSNKSTKTIPIDKGTVAFGSMKISASREIDGVIKITIDKMLYDVDIDVKTGQGEYHLEVDEGKYTTSKQDGMNDIGVYDENKVVFTPFDTSTIKGIKVTTSSKTTTAYFDSDSRIYVDGYYYDIGKDKDGNGYIIIDRTDRDLLVEPIVTDEGVLVTIYDEEGVSHNRKDKEVVEEGANYIVEFRPEENYSISSISLRYGGTIYRIDIDNENSYVYIDKVRHPVIIHEDGSVTIEILKVNENMTFDVNAQKQSGYSIETANDWYTTIVLDANGFVNNSQTVTATVTPTKGYKINSINLSVRTTNTIITNGQTKAILDGKTIPIEWMKDGSCKLTITGIGKDLKIASTGAYDKESVTVVGRHEPYLHGFGSGIFGVNSNMTRAEAVVMLTTQFFPNHDFTVDGNQHFVDIAGNVWYTNPVNFAASYGLLNSIIRQTGYFNPNAPITRAELVLLMSSFSKTAIPNTPFEQVFTDVHSWTPAAAAINLAHQNGWTDGYEDGSFRPYNHITRAEVAAMMNRMLGRRADPTADFSTTFSDVPKTHWAYLDIIEATNAHNVTEFGDKHEHWA